MLVVLDYKTEKHDTKLLVEHYKKKENPLTAGTGDTGEEPMRLTTFKQSSDFH